MIHSTSRYLILGTIATVFLWIFSAFANTSGFNISTEQIQPTSLVSVQLAIGDEPLVWADSVLETLSLEEKIGQLFMVAAYSNLGASHIEEVCNMIRTYHIGGLIFFQGGPVRQAKLTNMYQKLARLPLLIAIDGEWGLGMRLDSTISYPKQMTLGAINSNIYIYNMGAEIARQMKRMGIHINFAPVVDVNNNASNPVINYRSFGENPINVAKKGVAYMQGMQNNGLIATGKHFPGHGDTDVDSHIGLPVIKHNKGRLDKIELMPFRQLIRGGVGGMMVAHLHIPAYDNRKNYPTTLSENVVNGLLKDSLGFEGMVFTDALNMQGVAKNFANGEAEILAIKAGNDVLLFPSNLKQGISAIKNALVNGRLSEQMIDASVRKILFQKARLNLHESRLIAIENIVADLNTPQAIAIKEDLYEQAITLIENKEDFLPIQQVQDSRFASVNIGTTTGNDFQKYLEKYAHFDSFALANKNSPTAAYNKLLERLKNYDVVVVGIFDTSQKRGRRYGIADASVKFIQSLQTHIKVVTVVFGSPYATRYFEKAHHLVCAYEADPLMQRSVPQALFGAIDIWGKLPISASKKFYEGKGIKTKRIDRLAYATPERVGMSSKLLARIDTLAAYLIQDQVTPGCQILVAKDNKIVFNKSYGYYTYSKVEKVKWHTLYDVASITKVVASLQAIMYLVHKGKLDLEKSVVDYLPQTQGTNKAHMKLKDILTHQAGLISFINYWDNIRQKDRSLDKRYVQNQRSDHFPIRVSEQLYARADIQDCIWEWTLDSPLAKRARFKGKHRYWYSDVGFYIFLKIIEKQLGQPLHEFVTNYFYTPMGLQHMTYHPLKKYDKTQITPTELDTDIRMELIRGYVHDPGAALYGGTAGHAGVFSNATDLAAMMQMVLNKGVYAGTQFLDPATIAAFNVRPYLAYDNRRAIGWDKPLIENTGGGATSIYCSDKTFGHTGFTGTCVWVDPKYNLIYVFLSNRIYPSTYNEKLIEQDIRPRIHNMIYEAMGLTKNTIKP